jgi:UPF0755 protein
MKASAWWAGFCFIAFTLGACDGAPRGEAVWVEIPIDAPLSAVSESLAVHGIVASAEDFHTRALAGRRYREIKPGIYPLRPNMSMGQVMRILRRGRSPVAKVIVRERMTLDEVALEVEQRLGIDPALFIDAARGEEMRARVGARGASVEGYLYPTMYSVNKAARPDQVVRQMVDTFETRWNRAWYPRLDSMGITRDEAVTLASIIAGEMPHPEEILRVAAVYHNRLARGMRLQADPTVVYALGERRRLTFADYRVASEYNTYTFRGLPPGPIGQPSLASISAALYPDTSEDLYFVGRKDGRHEFSRTYREHLKTIAQIRAPKKPRHAPANVRKTPASAGRVAQGASRRDTVAKRVPALKPQARSAGPELAETAEPADGARP